LNVVNSDGTVHAKVYLVSGADVDGGVVLGPLDVGDAIKRIVREGAGDSKAFPGVDRDGLV
jgi:hypothetical protein